MCRFMLIVVFEYILEEEMIPSFSKTVTKDSGSNVRHKFFTM